MKGLDQKQGSDLTRTQRHAAPTFNVCANRLTTDVHGATAVEYALLAALLSLAGVVALASMGTSLDTIFTFVANTASSAAN